MSKDSDDATRALILSRRRRFIIASAVAGLSLTACDKPKPCLDVSRAETGEETGPGVCLTVDMPEDDAGAPDAAATDAGAADAGAADASADAGTPAPTPTPKPKPTPRVCLRYAKPPIKPTK